MNSLDIVQTFSLSSNTLSPPVNRNANKIGLIKNSNGVVVGAVVAGMLSS